MRLHAQLFAGVRRGVLISGIDLAERRVRGRRGINTITGADAIAPFGGAAFHDNRVWICTSSGTARVTT